MGSKVYVICVVQPPVLIDYSTKLTVQMEEALENQSKVLLARCASDAEQRNGIKVEPVLAKGYPPKVIIEKAKENDIDMIMIGSRGLGGIKEMFLGSVSHSVVRGSKVLVMVIK